MLLQFQLGSILPTGSSGGGFLALPCLSRLSTSSRRRRSCVVGIPVAMSVNGNGHSDNHYTLLGVSRFATFDEIKKAYRLLARKWHPDVNKNLQAVEVFKSVRVAYEVLSNKATRIQYDRELKAREEFSSMYSWTELRQKMQGKRYSNQYKNSGNSSFFYTETYEYVRDKASFERRGSFIQVLESAFISLFLMQTVGCRLSLTFSILMALFDAKLDGGYKVAYMIAWCLGGKGGILLTLFLSFASWAFGKTSSGTVAVVLIAMWIGSSLANCCPIPQGAILALLHMSIKLQSDLT